MRVSEMFPSKFLKAADIGDGERVFVISRIAYEEVGEDREMKHVVYFNGEKRGLVLNKTNALRLEYIAGSDDSNDWPGLEVTLFTELVSFGGKSAPAIRVKNTRPPKPANVPTTSVSAVKKAAAEIPPWVDDPEDPGVAA
jgi:hypothetical protein